VSAPQQPVSPRPRRIATPSWFDLRLVLGIVLVLVSVLIGAKIVSSATRTYERVAARHELEAGSILTASDVRLVRVQLPDHGTGVYLSALEDVVGKQLSRGVSEGELIPAAALGTLIAQTTITVPLETAAAPELRKGERIELWVSTSACRSLVLLPQVTVQAVRNDASGTFDPSSGEQDVVISVPPDLADRVMQALALDQAQLRAGVLVGPARDRTSSGTTGLPDLAPCAGAPR
jgi:hypothetical protein